MVLMKLEFVYEGNDNSDTLANICDNVVGHFQFRAMQGVQGLCCKSAGLTSDLPPSPVWITRFTAKHHTPRETPQKLRNHVCAPYGASKKRKRDVESNSPTIDANT